ncbi:Tn3 family transposase [Streptomyces roseus]|uniref:Tn3 family transposase n=1 Tax=Streptomyces roseus TaxID=66430 RepID=UPI00367EDBBA
MHEGAAVLTPAVADDHEFAGVPVEDRDWGGRGPRGRFGQEGIGDYLADEGDALRLLQSALVHVNTMLVRQVLVEPDWADRLADADRRGRSPLFWTHVNPYGPFELDTDSRLDLDLAAPNPSERTDGPQPVPAH